LGSSSDDGTCYRAEKASAKKKTVDWCHFVQRLPRSRVHKHLKNAELPFEDEKFSYVALSRTPAQQRPARVLAQPVVTKVAVTAKLCTDDGLSIATIARRDKSAYARYRKFDWGDAVFDSEAPRAE
jgi:ribosomal protein RSM22 (predicted rRNA methylase)